MLNFILGKGHKGENSGNESKCPEVIQTKQGANEGGKSSGPGAVKANGINGVGVHVLIAFSVVSCLLVGVATLLYISQPIESKQFQAFVQSKVFTNEVEDIVKSYLSRTYPDLDTDYLR